MIMDQTDKSVIILFPVVLCSATSFFFIRQTKNNWRKNPPVSLCRNPFPLERTFKLLKKKKKLQWKQNKIWHVFEDLAEKQVRLMLTKIQSFQEECISDPLAFYAGRVWLVEYIPVLVEFWWSTSFHKMLLTHFYPNCCAQNEVLWT